MASALDNIGEDRVTVLLMSNREKPNHINNNYVLYISFNVKKDLTLQYHIRLSMEKNLKEKNVFSKLKHTNTTIGLSIMAILVIGVGIAVFIAMDELGSAGTAKALKMAKPPRYGFVCTAGGACFRAYF